MAQASHLAADDISKEKKLSFGQETGCNNRGKNVLRGIVLKFHTKADLKLDSEETGPKRGHDWPWGGAI